MAKRTKQDDHFWASLEREDPKIYQRYRKAGGPLTASEAKTLESDLDCWLQANWDAIPSGVRDMQEKGTQALDKMQREVALLGRPGSWEIADLFLEGENLHWMAGLARSRAEILEVAKHREKKMSTKKKKAQKKATKKKGAKKATNKKGTKKGATKPSPLKDWQKVTVDGSPIPGRNVGQTTYVGLALIEELPLVVPVIIQPEKGKKEWGTVLVSLETGDIVTDIGKNYSTPAKAAANLGGDILPGPERTPTAWFKKVTKGKYKRAPGGDVASKTAANPCIGLHLHGKDFQPLLRALKEEGAMVAANPFGCAHDPTKPNGLTDFVARQYGKTAEAAGKIATATEKGYAKGRKSGPKKRKKNPREHGETWIVEMTINSRVRPVRVKATTADRAKDEAERKHPEAERTWGAYTLAEWRQIMSETKKGAKKRKKNPRDKDTYIEYLEGTLIPDLKESGSEYTAEDFEGIVKFLRGARSHDGRTVQEHVEFLEETLIPDLYEAGSEFTAEDFEDGIEILREYGRVQNPSGRPDRKYLILAEAFEAFRRGKGSYGPAAHLDVFLDQRCVADVETALALRDLVAGGLLREVDSGPWGAVVEITDQGVVVHTQHQAAQASGTRSRSANPSVDMGALKRKLLR